MLDDNVSIMILIQDELNQHL